MVHQVSSALDHPTCTTGWAEATAFAGERHQVFVPAGITLDAQEPVLEQAALQVVVELLFDERGQRSAVSFQLGKKLYMMS